MATNNNNNIVSPSDDRQRRDDPPHAPPRAPPRAPNGQQEPFVGIGSHFGSFQPIDRPVPSNGTPNIGLAFQQLLASGMPVNQVVQLLFPTVPNVPNVATQSFANQQAFPSFGQQVLPQVLGLPPVLGASYSLPNNNNNNNNASVQPPPDQNGTLLDRLAQESRAVVLGGSAEANESIRKSSSGSVKYNRAKMQVFESVVDHVAENPSMAALAALEANKYNTNDMIPAWIRAVQGVVHSDPRGRGILNTVFISWFNTQTARDKVTPMQPSSFATKCRKAFAVLHGQFGVLIGMKDLKGEGSLHAVTMTKWQLCINLYAEFGCKPNRKPLTDQDKRNIEDFIGSDQCDKLQMARHIFVYSNGIQNAARGRQDHKNLTWDSVKFGVFEDGHEFAGKEFVQIGFGLTGKNHQITLGNTEARVDREPPRHLVTNQPWNIGCALKKLRDSTPPTAKFVLMKLASKSKRRMFIEQGYGVTCIFDDETAMGESAIGACTQQLAQLAGIDEWKSKTNHCLCQHAITAMANDPNTNQVETAAIASHSSVTTQASYIRTNASSEAARIKALQCKDGVVPI